MNRKNQFHQRPEYPNADKLLDIMGRKEEWRKGILRGVCQIGN